MRKLVLAVAVGATMVPTLTLADETAVADADPVWTGTVEFGLAASRGNTDSDTLRSRLGLATTNERGRHELGLAFLYGEQDGVESAYRYEAFGKSNLRLIDGGALVDLVLHHYEKFDSRYKGLLPLRRVYVPEIIQEGEE